MAAMFIGLHMRVILRDPPGYEVTGTVRDVEAGSCLTLTNVFGPGAQDWAPEMRIEAINIIDLCEVQRKEPQSYYAPIPVEHTKPIARAPLTALDDPAILSLSRHPASSASSTRERGSPRLVENISELGDDDLPGVLKGIHVGRGLRALTPIEDVAESLNGLSIVDNGAHELDTGKSTDFTTDTDNKSQKRRRRHRKSSKKSKSNPDSETSPSAAVPTTGRGKGWRQTPILQSTASFQPFSSLKRNGKGLKADDFGWESAEVTEEMGEFDFENNLAKFDKRTVFDQLRKEDQVDDASRLVSHNRKPKPGTNGGKNFHYTENVLEVPPNSAKNADFWNSEADDGHNGVSNVNGVSGLTGERPTTREIRSMSSNRRADSKSSAPRRSQSRKASGAMIGGQPLSRVSSSQSHQSGLYITGSNRRLEAISTLQMLNLENIAANEVGFTEDLMAENAGRGLAEVAVRALSDPATKVRFELASANSSGEILLSSSTTVILAGNNKSSIRALAAARHLRNRNIDVVFCLVGIERERDLLEDLRRQTELYRSFGGKVFSKTEFFEHLRKNAATGSRVPISLIIDAMLGLTTSFEDLRVGDQATVYELMEWANRNEAFVLAIDVPSGIDPTTGKIAIIDGGRLFVKPKYVVCMGAPKRGLLEAVAPPSDDDPEMLHHVALEDGWRLFVADIGLGSAVWKKAGTKLRRGIDFDGQWVLEMEYRTTPVVSSEERL